VIVAARTYTLDLVLEAPHLTALDVAKETIDGKLRLIEAAVRHSLNLPPGVRVLRAELKHEGI